MTTPPEPHYRISAAVMAMAVKADQEQRAEIAQLRDRLALAEQQVEHLTAERDEFRQMARFSQRDEDAMDIIHRAADLLRPDVDMGTRLALAEQALVDAGLREDRLRVVVEAARAFRQRYDYGGSGNIKPEVDALRSALDAAVRLDETTPPAT